MQIKIDDKTIYFAQTRDGAKIPTKEAEDGCYDLYAYKEHDGQVITIEPFETKLIATGIASAFSKKYRIQLRKRGSNTKWRALLNGGEIDSGYRGEWFVAIVNSSPKTIEIRDNISDVLEFSGTIQFPFSKAICQFALEIVPDVEVETLSYDVLREIPSKRGDGKLGASGK